jgi:AbrB family looped-hinge helix DNA binding protein
MPYKATITLSSKGQLTLPAELRRLWNLKAGDSLRLEYAADGSATMAKAVRRSILESRNELVPLSLGRRVTQKDIDKAVAAAMRAQERRSRPKGAR